MAFAKIRTLIRKVAARKYDQLWQAVESVCSILKEEECYNFVNLRREPRSGGLDLWRGSFPVPSQRLG